MPYVDVRGIVSHYEVAGDGPPIVVLHGGFCSLETLREMAGSLTSAYRVHAVERPGHGRTPDRDGPYSYAGAVDDTLAYLDAVGLADAHVVGYSDGAIIGLMIARDHPDRVRSLVAISANIDVDGFVAEDQHERAMPAAGAQLIDDQYAALSPDGPEHAAVVTAKLHAMWAVEPDIPAAGLGAIVAPGLVMAGQHDLVRLDHTELIAASIPDAQLCIVPGASHLLVADRPALVGQVIREFLDAVADLTSRTG